MPTINLLSSDHQPQNRGYLHIHAAVLFVCVVSANCHLLVTCVEKLEISQGFK